MIMHKKLFFAVLTVLIFSFLTTPVWALEDSSDNTIPKTVLQAAEEGLSQYKSAVKSDLDRWELSSVEEADQVTLGDGYEVVYLGENILTSSTKANLLSLEDNEIYSTWMFVLELKGEAKTFMIICKEGGVAYQFSGFGGDPTYFSNAVNAIHEFTGNAVKPTLLSYGQQDFLLAVKDDEEYVIPVPYNEESNEKVVSGEGAVESSQLILAIQKAHQEYMEKYSDSEELPVGSFYIDVWGAESNESIAIILLVASIAALVLIATCVVIAANRQNHSKQNRLRA